MPINEQWLTKRRILTSDLERPVEHLSSVIAGCANRDDLIVHQHPERPRAENIQQQRYSQPTET